MTNKESIQKWLKYWYNGGGCYSLYSYICDTVLDELKDDTPLEDMREQMLEYDPYFGCYNVYEQVVNEMIDELTGRRRR